MNKGTVLIVDDTPANLDLLNAMLSEEGYEVRPAINGQMALMAARMSPPDAILLDINMPGKNGYEVCIELKQDERTAEIPVIFLSALDDTADKVKAFHVGGVDYVTKPFQFEEVLARVESQLTLARQRREIEDLRRRDRERFEELSRMKDQFVSTVSHDLKNPINNIMGYAQMIMEDADMADPEELRDMADKVQRSAKQMLDLVTDLLDLARIEAGMGLQPAPISLNSFLREQYTNFEFQARQKNLTYKLVTPPQDVTLVADSSRLGQALNNLLSNAVKYTPAVGRVELAADAADELVTIRVRDTGLGIPPEDLPHLFDKFYRVHSEQHLRSEGTGLGLSIVKAIIEQHRGRIFAESLPGQGSTFSILLPV